MVEPLSHLGLIDDADVALDRAALQIAALDHPEAEVEAYLALLDDMATRLEASYGSAAGPREQAAGLAEVLAVDFGFEADRESYDDPANGDLICVIDRRRGLPIALAIIYVSVARRLGWTAHPLNTPAHVLVAVGAPRHVVIDPFNGGAVVGPRQLARFLSAVVGGADAVVPEHAAPMTNRAALVRLVMNEVTRAEAARRFDRALILLERITAVAPAYSFAWWRRAQLEQAAGELVSARNSLTAMLETTRDPKIRTRVTGVLRTLGG